MSKKKIAIFASGSGTNAVRIFDDVENESDIEVAIVLTNNPNAGVIEKAKSYGISVKVFNRKEFYETSEILNFLTHANIDLIVLAGFLWLLPKNFIQAFPNRIINIHPALLPKFGGKGMYGMNVHKAIIDAKEKESGITIHYVNEAYDEGEVILQEKCPVTDRDTAEDLAKKVQSLEHLHFPKTIIQLLKNRN